MEMASEMVSELSQKYNLKQEIGRGGFSVTWKAYRRKEPVDQRQPVLIKELLLDRIDDWNAVEQFEREARILSHLKNPHIPEFFEFLEQPQGDSKRLFLVQEFLDGQNLETLIQQGKYFTETEVLQIAQELCGVLNYLHAFSPPIIHRDIKPSNLLLRESDDRVYLIDFGAVKGPAAMNNSQGYTVTGTVGYMPLEQVEGKAVPASDIYALGMSLIFLLSHQDPTQLPKKNLKADFRPYVNISERFAKVLDRMIEPDVKHRIASATELQKELEKVSPKPHTAQLKLPTDMPTRSWKTLAVAGAVLLLLGYCSFKKERPSAQAMKPPSPSPSPSTVSATPLPAKAIKYMSSEDLWSQAEAYYDSAPAKAIPYYSAYLQKHPQDLQAHYHRGYCYGENEEYPKALEDYEIVLKKAPDKYSLLQYNLGYVQYNLEHYATALSHFKQQLQTKPKYVDALNYVGLCYRHLKRYPEAIAAYHQTIALKPDYKYPYNNLGRLYHDTGEPQKALKWYRKAIEVAPDYSLPHFNLGEFYYDQGQYSDCIDEETHAIEMSNTYASAHNMRGLCYRKLKQLDQALEDFQVAVNENSQYETAYYNLGLTYDDKELFPEAIKYYKKALEIDPGHSSALNNLGYIYQRQKNYAQALDDYRQALKVKPDSALYHRNLGDLYKDMKQCDQAKLNWKQACKLGAKKACTLNCP